MTPDEARKELRLFFKHEWHDYIDNTLADDFAGELATKMREHHDMQTNMALCAESEAFANARIAELETELTESKSAIPPLAEVKDILKLPNFTCGRFAEILRRVGHDIPCKAEDEQAYVIHFFLGYWKEFGENWQVEANKSVASKLQELKAAGEQSCPN